MYRDIFLGGQKWERDYYLGRKPNGGYIEAKRSFFFIKGLRVKFFGCEQNNNQNGSFHAIAWRPATGHEKCEIDATFQKSDIR
jgi:hypothetical protein